MCRPTRCRSCGNTTWAGCGNHVQQVMADVPEDQRCDCASRSSATSGDEESSGGWLNRLRGR